MRISLTLVLFSFSLLAHSSYQSAVPTDLSIKSEKKNQIKQVIQELGYEHLLFQATQKIDLSYTLDLFDIIKYCSIEDENINGHYKSPKITKDIYTRESNPVEYEYTEMFLGYRLGGGNNEYNRRITKRSGFYIIERVNTPSICLNRKSSILQSSLTLLHELYHLIHDDYFEGEDLLYLPKEDFVYSKLYENGGEFEAHSFNIFLAKKVQEVYGDDSFIKRYAGVLDEQTNQIDPQGLEDYLLADLNYHEHYLELYSEFREAKKVELIIYERYLKNIEFKYQEQLNILLTRKTFSLDDPLGPDIEIEFYERAIADLKSEYADIYGRLDILASDDTKSWQNP